MMDGPKRSLTRQTQFSRTEYAGCRTVSPAGEHRPKRARSAQATHVANNGFRPSKEPGAAALNWHGKLEPAFQKKPSRPTAKIADGQTMRRMPRIRSFATETIWSCENGSGSLASRLRQNASKRIEMLTWAIAPCQQSCPTDFRFFWWAGSRAARPKSGL